VHFDNVDWDKIRIFYYVATSKSFTDAAERLNITQSAVSRSIQSFEASLNAKLFHRHTRGLILTKNGEIMFETAREMLTTLSRAQRFLDDSETPKGILKVSTTAALANLWLVEGVAQFLDMYPEMRLTILGNDQALDLAIREADVAIRPAVEHPSDLVQNYLMTFHIKLYAHPSYLQKFGVPQKVEDLDMHRLISFAEDSISPYGNINWPLTIGAKPGHIRKPYLTINSTQGLRRAVEVGLGIAAISEEYPGLKKESNLVHILPEIKGPDVDLYYVYPSYLAKSKEVTAFGDYLTERCSNVR
jgi:DNA-binding transcriptional LysR family regulator